MKWLLETLCTLHKNRRQFYINCKAENITKNLHILQISSLCSLLLFIFFSLIAPLMVPSWKIRTEYFLYIPVGLLFFLFTLFYSSKKREKDVFVQWVCLLFCAALIGYILLIDIFPYPQTPSSFFPLLLIVLPIIFIFHFKIIYTIILLGEGTYILLTSLYKPESIAQNDIFNSLAALLFSFAVFAVVTNLRIQNNNAKRIYQKLIGTDQLTGVSSKSACEKAVVSYLAKHTPQTPSSLVILDIDNFKMVNDALGHQAGDAVLAQTGKALCAVFSDSAIIGRIGGDEFLLYIKTVNSRDELKTCCSLLLEEIRQTVLQNLSIETAVSAGAVLFQDSASYEELFRLADQALYQAKHRGKGQFALKEFASNIPPAHLSKAP